MKLKKRHTVKFRSHCGDIYGVISSFFDLSFTGVPCVKMRYDSTITEYILEVETIDTKGEK